MEWSNSGAARIRQQLTVLWSSKSSTIKISVPEAWNYHLHKKSQNWKLKGLKEVAIDQKDSLDGKHSLLETPGSDHPRWTRNIENRLVRTSQARFLGHRKDVVTPFSELDEKKLTAKFFLRQFKEKNLKLKTETSDSISRFFHFLGTKKNRQDPV